MTLTDIFCFPCPGTPGQGVYLKGLEMTKMSLADKGEPIFVFRSRSRSLHSYLDPLNFFRRSKTEENEGFLTTFCLRRSSQAAFILHLDTHLVI